jgi:GntR family transcriptional regulator, transcriptional repressor for pyruvate dehydrogenase complex
MSISASSTPPRRAPARRGLPVVYGSDKRGDGGVESGATRRRAMKLSEVIAGELVRDIIASGLEIGDHLAPEATMLVQYGVGRESLREALRLLESQGLITIKRGPGGGPVVAGVDPLYLARTASLFFHVGGATYDEVIEAWHVLEPAMAAQVARHPSRAAVAQALTPYLYPGGDSAQAQQSKDTGFHTTLAQLSGSRVMVLLLQALGHMLVDHVADALGEIEDWEGVEREHAEIAEAILNGRATKAQRLMEKHIGGVRDNCAERWPDRMLDPVVWL